MIPDAILNFPRRKLFHHRSVTSSMTRHMKNHMHHMFQCIEKSATDTIFCDRQKESFWFVSFTRPVFKSVQRLP